MNENKKEERIDFLKKQLKFMLCDEYDKVLENYEYDESLSIDEQLSVLEDLYDSQLEFKVKNFFSFDLDNDTAYCYFYFITFYNKEKQVFIVSVDSEDDYYKMRNKLREMKIDYVIFDKLIEALKNYVSDSVFMNRNNSSYYRLNVCTFDDFLDLS